MQKQQLEVFYEGVLKNFANFTGKNLCWSLFNEVADQKACNFIKKRPQRKCFLVKFAKFLRATVLKNICERLLLKMVQDLYLLLTCIQHMIPFAQRRLYDCTVLIDLLSRTIYILLRDRYNNNFHAGDIVYVFGPRILSY